MSMYQNSQGTLEETHKGNIKTLKWLTVYAMIKQETDHGNIALDDRNRERAMMVLRYLVRISAAFK